MIDFLGITHVLFAITLYILLFDFNLYSLIFVSIGSLLPDIDHPGSVLGKYNMLSVFMKHRGLTHTIIATVILSGLVATWNVSYAFAFGFGYFLHLVSDWLTPSGIMWLYPFKKKYYSLSKKNNLAALEGIIFGLCLIYLFKGKIL